MRIANQDKRAREFYTFLIALTLGLLVSVPTQIVVAPSAVAAQESECVIGSSALCPATSPQEIYNLYGTTTDRTYFIKVNGVATEVFVLMNRTGSDNGGWILLMKGTQGTSNFAYTSTMFTSNTSTLNPSSLTNDVATDAKFSAYNNLSIVKMLGVLRNPATGTITANGDIASNAFGGHVWFETFGASTAYTKLTTTTSLNSPANDNFTSVPERKWKTTVNGSQVLSYQPGFGRYGFNGSPCSNTDFQYRWGIAWNQEADWSSCDVVVGIGLVSRSPGDHVIWSGVTTGSVTSNTGHGNTGFQIWGKVAEPSLGAPTSVTATASGSGQINLSWGAPTATSPVDYVVQYKTAAAGSYSNSFIVSGQTTATINGLTNGASYNFRVFARTAGDSTSAANIANSTIIKSVSSQLSTPTAPTVSATSNTLKSIDVSWSAISNASSYTVKVYNDSSTLLSTSGLTGLTGTSTTITTTNLASLADATPYKVSITAIGNGSSFLDSSESLKSDVTTTGAALTPTFGSATATADGFTVQISNHSASYTWAGSATASGSVAINGTGLVTVTGVAPGTQSVATITTTRTGYTSGTATATGTSITGAALTPTFGTPTATADGFTVQISNYSGDYTWAGSATASGSVAISGTGLVTVTGVAPGTQSVATITTTRTGYTSGTATATGTSITGAALTPTFGTPTATADGFTVQISNYSASYTWAGTATASGSVAINGTGLVTVTGVAPGTASTATITTTRTGYTSGSATATGTSITGSALTPTFGSPTATADGFTVQISNYSASYTWAGTATASGSVAINGTGLVTVTGVAPGTQSVATITTTRTGYTGGSAPVTGTSISGAALTPTFGSATATADGYTVQISNYSASYTWAGSATASGSVAIDGSGLVTVTGVAPGTQSVATITTTRTGYTSGSATATGTSITGAALTPTFGTPTATADGFTVQISNYSASYTWAGTATASGSVAINGTGLVTVTGVAPGTQSVATITTTRTGYTGGSAPVTGTSITGSALTPTFGTPTATADGYTVQISNYSASYTWAGTATASGSVAISGEGLITVTGVAPGTTSVATITTTRTGYTGGSATVSGTSITGSVLTPTFGTTTATADGFTVSITNYSASYTWAGSATASGTVAISGTGLVTVTGVAPGTQSVATITTTRTGYTSGSATVTGTSITGSALTPTFGSATATNSGFTVQISNYSASYTWAGTATASGSVSINGTGLVTVTGVGPGKVSVATITTTRTGYTSGSATVTATANRVAATSTVVTPGTDAALVLVRTTFLQTNPIAARVNTPSKVTFLANNRAIPGCSALKTVLVSSNHTATCNYRPTSLGSLTLSATITPNDTGYIAVTRSVKVVVSPK